MNALICERYAQQIVGHTIYYHMSVNCFSVHLLSQLSLLNCRHHYISIAYVFMLG